MLENQFGNLDFNISSSSNSSICEQNTKKVDIIEKLIREHLYINGFKDEEINSICQSLRYAYYNTKEEHKLQERNTGEAYFLHPLSALTIAYNEFPQYIVNEIVLEINNTILSHDILEDTNIHKYIFIHIFGETSYNAVKYITKGDWLPFIKDSSHKKQFEDLKSTGLFNDDFEINKSTEDKLCEGELTDSEIASIKELDKISRIYKNLRNDVYKDNLIKLSQKYKKSNNLKERIEMYLALFAKGVDLLDNLRKAEVYKDFNKSNLEKIERKIEEVIEFYYEIFIDMFPDIYSALKDEVTKLESYIITKKVIKNISYRTKEIQAD